jgi:protein SCO1/2
VPGHYSERMTGPARPVLHHFGLALVLGFAVGAVLSGCSAPQARQYPLRGQVMAIGNTRPDGRTDVTVKHDDIPTFMPAMTMAYFVKERRLIEGLAPGDLITAQLVVDGSDIYLTGIRKMGHAALPPEARPIKIMDVMQPGDFVPEDPLEDQSGATRRLSDWRGRALAVTFVYTRCPLPDFCPLMDQHFAEIARLITKDAPIRDRVHLLSISFDPAHDTPAVIRGHAAARGADGQVWSYLTGTPAAIDHVTSRFGVSVIQDTNGPTLTHNLRTAIVDPKGRLVTIYSGNDWTVSALLADLRSASGR